VVQKIVEIHYNEEVFEFYSTMQKLENQLYGKGFVRTHRSFLVNKEHISYVMGDELVLDNDEIVPLHQKYAKKLGMGKEAEDKSGDKNEEK
jgi:DNA-binding LytR/AlgR family response regulator